MTIILLSLLGPKGLVFATINPSNYSATISLQNQSAMEITPTDWSQDIYVSTMRTVNVTSTGLSEYKIFANIPSSDSANGSLVMVGGTSSSPTVSQVNARPSTATTLSTDTWGFGIPSGTSGLPTNSFSNQYTAGTPSTSSTYSGYDKAPAYTLLRDVTNATGNDTFNLYYSVRAGADVLTNPGTYQTNVDYHIVGNASDVSGGEATISPASGPNTGGTTVTITTSMMVEFVPPNISVSIGGQTCASPSGSVSSGVLVITCTAPAHQPGATNVVVDVASLDMTYTIPNGYTYIETGDVRITNVAYVSGVNVSGTPQPTVDSNNNIDFDLTFNGGQDNTTTLEATYRLTITNSTSSDFTFTAPESTLALRISATEVRDISYTLSGISVGDTIPANSAVSFNIIFSADYVSGEHGTEGGVSVDPVNQDVGNIIGYFTSGTTGDLSGNNTLTGFQITVENTFDQAKSFTIGSLNSGFEIVDSSGNALGAQSIAANTVGSYTFYMKKSSNASFASETATADIIISYDSTYTNVGEVQITVDRDPAFIDTEAPTIRDVTITPNNTVDGEATLTWSGSDNVGIASYGIYVCTTTCGNMITVSNTTTSYTFSNLQDTTYHFVVVGFDDERNTASQAQIDSNNTNPGPACSTGDKNLDWGYDITSDITNGNLSHTSGGTVRAGGTYTGQITPGSAWWGNYDYPSSITVQMNGVTLSSNEYSYESSGNNAGRVIIQNASGNIYITATCSGCLIEGTMIALADGTEIPIEEVTYHDQLKVWNYETGTVGAEYPAWIEKVKSSGVYQVTTLSDGTELKTLGWHGVFSVDDNEFVSVDNPETFGVGTTVYKVVDDELVPVTVTKIEAVWERVNYYHVVSSQYYNVIADGVLTTDGTVTLSNLYGFDENVKWPALRNQIVSNPLNLYTYEDFADIGMPRRMFDELRVQEGKYLNNRYGIGLEEFKRYLVGNQLNPDMWLPYDDE